MDLTEIVEELCENHPEKMVVDISEYEDDNHQSYKHLYEITLAAKRELEEANFTMAAQHTTMEKDLADALDELKELKRRNNVISKSLIPTMDSIKSFCMEKIFVTNVTADPEHISEKVFDIDEFAKTISAKPGVYGKQRPSWFTPLQHELSKEAIQKKNIKESSVSIKNLIMFWKKEGKRVQTDPETVAAEYDQKRKEIILELISSDCSNEEKYLKYFLITPGLDKEFLKTLQGASELNIDARLLIALLEQPNNRFNKSIIENYVSKLHKGTEYNLKQELAEELVRGDWYIVSDINGSPEKYQAVPVSILENLVDKINAICDFLDSSADDELSANLAESSSNEIKEVDLQDEQYETETSTSEEIPSFVMFDDSML